MSNKNYMQPSMKKRRLKRAVVFTLLAFLLVIGGGAAAAYTYVKSMLEPADPDNHTPVSVTIPTGSSLSVIAETLEKKGIVKNAEAFKYYAKYSNETEFKAGIYQFTPSMTHDQLIESLQAGNTMENAAIKITIPEGYQLSEIAAVISGQTDYSKEEVFARLNDRTFIQKLMKKYPDLLTNEIFGKEIKYPLEGYLYPATYAYYDPETPLDVIIEDMIAKTDRVVAQYNGSRAAKKMTVHQMLTMSSLIEEEATEQADRHKISSVFYNRIDADMPLQTDPTVLYALGQHKDRVLYNDLEVESPYNTYKVKGLTPGPIGNSGVTSIEAALNPAETDYLYFLASPAGDVYYSKTLEEHNRLKEKYITSSYKNK
ncbi:MAG TPA: endolytic transglycosylase MltG [Chondromyces sp.]|nr:endolytic transglycosylase MltG [Chondromyces sp.]